MSRKPKFRRGQVVATKDSLEFFELASWWYGHDGEIRWDITQDSGIHIKESALRPLTRREKGET
jgi:hypothetical protein